MALSSATPIVCNVFFRIKALACCRRSEPTLREATVHKQEVVVAAKEGAAQKKKARRRACSVTQDTVADAPVGISHPVDGTVPDVILDESFPADVEDSVAEKMPVMMSWAAITEAEDDDEDFIPVRSTSVTSCDSHESTSVYSSSDRAEQPRTPPGMWLAEPSAGLECSSDKAASSHTTVSDVSEADDSVSDHDDWSIADSFSEDFVPEEDELPWQIHPVVGGVYGMWPQEDAPPGIWLMSGYISSQPFDEDECSEVVQEEKAEYAVGSSSPTTASDCGESVSEQSDNHDSVEEELDAQAA